MTNLYEHGLWSLYSPLPSLYSNPWRGQVFPLILFTSLSLHSQSPRTPQQQPSAPSSTNNNKASQVENYYVLLSSFCPNPSWPASLFFSCPPASVPHWWWDTSCALIFSHACLGCDDIHELTHKRSYLWSVFDSAAVLALCYLCEQRECFTHGAHSHPWHPSFDRSTFTLQYMKKKRVAFDTSCLRWAGYIAATFFFFSSYCTPDSVTVIVRAVSLRLADEKSQLQIFRCWIF